MLGPNGRCPTLQYVTSRARVRDSLWPKGQKFVVVPNTASGVLLLIIRLESNHAVDDANLRPRSVPDLLHAPEP